jgi:hypothetical protein
MAERPKQEPKPEQTTTNPRELARAALQAALNRRG